MFFVTSHHCCTSEHFYFLSLPVKPNKRMGSTLTRGRITTLSHDTPARYCRRKLLSMYIITFPEVNRCYVLYYSCGLVFMCTYGCVLIPYSIIPPYHCRCSQSQLSFHSAAAMRGAMHAGACFLSQPFWHIQRCSSSRLCVEDYESRYAAATERDIQNWCFRFLTYPRIWNGW